MSEWLGFLMAWWTGLDAPGHDTREMTESRRDHYYWCLVTGKPAPCTPAQVREVYRQYLAEGRIDA